MLVTYPGNTFTTKLSEIKTSRIDQKLLTTAMNKRKKRLRIAEQFKIRVWNVRGLTHKETPMFYELQRELNLIDVDIAIIPGTKKKLKGSTELAHYVLIHSGVAAGKRAAAGSAVMIKKRLENSIHSCHFVNEGILRIRCKTIRGYTTLVTCLLYTSCGKRSTTFIV